MVKDNYCKNVKTLIALQHRTDFNPGLSRKIFQWKEGVVQFCWEKFKEERKIIKKWNLLFADSELEKISRTGILPIAMWEDSYPRDLLHLYDPPVIIYLRSCKLEKYLDHWKSENRSRVLAIVGTRSCSKYGIEIAKEIAFKTSQTGTGIISGLALGIDGAAHKATLNYQRQRLLCKSNHPNNLHMVVLGCGHQVSYPKNHESLLDAVLEMGGCVISEFACSIGPRARFFPQRNRLISALSDAVLVVESDRRGGSLITARISMELGKDVFSVPGPLNVRQSLGTNKLIQDGAHPVLSSEEFLLQWLGYAPSEQKLDVLESVEDDMQRKLMQFLEKESVVSAENLAENVGMSLSEVKGILSQMEVNGIIYRVAGGIYALHELS